MIARFFCVRRSSSHGQPAFTLIELLIVITIMGILGSVVVMNFADARQRQQLALLADKSLALLQQARMQVRAGHFVDGAYVCEGAHFVSGEETTKITTPYLNGACDFSGELLEESYGLSSGGATVRDVLLGDLEEGSLVTYDDVYVLFSPSGARLFFYDSSGILEKSEGRITFSSDGSTSIYDLALDLYSQTGLLTLRDLSLDP